MSAQIVDSMQNYSFLYLRINLSGILYLPIGLAQNQKTTKNNNIPIAILKKLCYTLLVSNTKISI